MNNNNQLSQKTINILWKIAKARRNQKTGVYYGKADIEDEEYIQNLLKNSKERYVKITNII